MGNVFAQMQKLMSWTGGPVNWDLADEVATGATRAGDVPVTARADAARSPRPAVWPTCGSTRDDAARRAARSRRPGRAPAGSTSTTPAWRSWSTRSPAASSARWATAPGAGPRQRRRARGPAARGRRDARRPRRRAAASARCAASWTRSAASSSAPRSARRSARWRRRCSRRPRSACRWRPPAGRRCCPANLAAFSAGLEVPADEVRLYVALRELAHQRLFASRAVAARRTCSTPSTPTPAASRSTRRRSSAPSARSTRPTRSRCSAPMGEGLFDIEPTPAQQAALARLETALALVEGWVDAVVDAACSGTLPSAAALRETVRRRRASGGPAEQTFATLVGLQLRPRRLREAAALWAAVAERGGIAGRDALWAHPDLLPVGRATSTTPRASSPAPRPAPRPRPTGTPGCADARQGPRRRPSTTTRPAAARRAVAPADFLASTALAARFRRSTPSIDEQMCTSIHTRPHGPVHRDTRPVPTLSTRCPQAVGDGVDGASRGS